MKCPRCKTRYSAMKHMACPECERIKALVGRSATICPDCAKVNGLMDAYYASDHGVLPHQGPDSACDGCGKEKGGRVFIVPPRPGAEGK